MGNKYKSQPYSSASCFVLSSHTHSSWKSIINQHADSAPPPATEAEGPVLYPIDYTCILREVWRNLGAPLLLRQYSIFIAPKPGVPTHLWWRGRHVPDVAQRYNTPACQVCVCAKYGTPPLCFTIIPVGYIFWRAICYPAKQRMSCL